MSQTLSLANFDQPNLGETAQLGADVAIGATSITIEYTDNLDAGDYLYLGRLGSESGEQVTINTVTSATTVILVSGTLKEHRADDPVTVLFGNKIKVYRAPNTDNRRPADNQYVFLETISIDFDQVATNYLDEDGGSNYWYKYIYLNESSAQETSLDSSQAVRGGVYGVYCSLGDIRSEAGLKNAKNLPDATVSMYRRRAQAEIDSKLGTVYTVPFNPVPDAINEIATLLGAGWLLLKEYGAMNEGNRKSGGAKVKEARDWLSLIQTGAAGLPDAEAITGEPDRSEGVYGLEDTEPTFRVKGRF